MAKKLDDNEMVSFKELLMANPSRLIPPFVCLSRKVFYTHQILAGHVLIDRDYKKIIESFRCDSK